MNTASRRTATSGRPLASFEQMLRDERLRQFRSDRWFGPIGLTAATLLLVLVLPDPLPDVIWYWVIASGIVSVLMMASFAIPTIERRVNFAGLPRLSTPAHLLAGVVWGSLLWLDLDLSEDPLVRWPMLAAIFAVSSGASLGLAGSNNLSYWLLAPMWTFTCGALVVLGEWVVAVAAMLFVGIAVSAIRETGVMWRSHVELRYRTLVTAEEYAYDAAHDSLTGALNRSGLLARVGTGADTSELLLLYIDLDDFKSVNDMYGHAAGDEVLRCVADRLTAASRAGDLVARIGGDEFIVVLDGMGTDELQPLIARLEQSLADPIKLPSGELVEIAASVGSKAATRRDAAERFGELLSDADVELYRVKGERRRSRDASSADS